jgi:hypothetical protein
LVVAQRVRRVNEIRAVAVGEVVLLEKTTHIFYYYMTFPTF